VLAGKWLNGWCQSVGLLQVVLLEGIVVDRAARERRYVVESIISSEMVRQQNIT